MPSVLTRRYLVGLYSETLGTGGTTYSESVGMSAAASASPSVLAFMAGSIGLASSASIPVSVTAALLGSVGMAAGAETTVPGSSLSAQLAITLSQVAGLAVSYGSGAYQESIDLTSSSALSVASLAALVQGVSLTAVHTLPSSTEGRLAASVSIQGATSVSPVAVAAMVGSMSLTSVAALTPAGNLLAAAAALLQAAHSLGVSDGGPQTYQESVGMAAAVAAFTAAVAGMGSGVSLTATSTLTPDAATRLGAIIALQVGAAANHSASVLHQTAVSLSGSTGVGAGSLAQFRSAALLSAISTLNTAGLLAGVPTYEAIRVAVALLKMAGISPDTADIRQAGTDPQSVGLRQAGPSGVVDIEQGRAVDADLLIPGPSDPTIN